MGKTITVDDIEVELDDDITEGDLDAEPTPENALTDEELAAIEAEATEDEVTPGE